MQWAFNYFPETDILPNLGLTLNLTCLPKLNQFLELATIHLQLSLLILIRLCTLTCAIAIVCHTVPKIASRSSSTGNVRFSDIWSIKGSARSIFLEPGSEFCIATISVCKSSFSSRCYENQGNDLSSKNFTLFLLYSN